MAHTGARRPERDRRKYSELRELHLAANPNYDAGWHRPTPTTAEKVWELAAPGMQIKVDQKLGSLHVSDLLDNKGLTPDDISAVELQAKQALVVMLDLVLSHGDGAMPDANAFFDAIAVRWSDHYRKARETTLARNAWAMTEKRINDSWRDLVVIGLRFDRLLNAVRHRVRGLYGTALKREPLWKNGRPVMRGGRTQVRSRYRVTVAHGSPLLAEFLRIVNADPDYQRARKYPRLVRADEEPGPGRDILDDEDDLDDDDLDDYELGYDQRARYVAAEGLEKSI